MGREIVNSQKVIMPVVLLFIIVITAGCFNDTNGNDPESPSDTQVGTVTYTNPGESFTEEIGIVLDESVTDYSDTDTGSSLPVTGQTDKLTVDDPEIQLFLSRLELFNRVCSCSRSIEVDSNQTDATGQYLKVTEPEIDTWEKWSELIDSVFCDNLKESAARLCSNIHRIDDDMYIEDPIYDEFVPFFSYELVTDKTGNTVLKVKGIIESNHSLPEEYRRFYILEHSESGWKVKYILEKGGFTYYYDNVMDCHETYNNSENTDISDDEISDLVRRFNKFFLCIREPASISVNYSNTDLSGFYHMITDRDISTWQKWTDFVRSVFDDEIAEYIADNQTTIIEHNSKTYTRDFSGNTWGIREGTYSVSTDELGNVLLTCHYKEADVGSGTHNYFLHSMTYILSHSDDGWRIRYYIGTDTEYIITE